jgi:hypothetical protein
VCTFTMSGLGLGFTSAEGILRELIVKSKK